MPDFSGMQCPDCTSGIVKKVYSNNGGWYWGCSRFNWDNYGSCRSAWHQDGSPYDSAIHRLKKPGFWSRLFGRRG